MMLRRGNYRTKALLAFVVFFALFCAYSCNKASSAQINSGTASTTSPIPAFNVTVNGSDPGGWTVTGSVNSGFIIIDGTAPGGITVGLQISATSTGTYKLGSSSGNSGVYGTSAPTTSYGTTGKSPYTGTLLISAYNAQTKIISGTFSFEAHKNYPDTLGIVKVAGGSFSNVSW